MNCRRWLAIVATLTSVLCTSCSDARDQSAAVTDPAQVPIEVVDFAGLEEAIVARRGEGFLLNFWAIWCAPCVAELPELVEVARANDGRLLTVSYDLMVAGADAATIEERIRAFLVQRDLGMPVLVYEELDFNAIDARFGLPGEIPVTLAIDAAGAIVDRQEGQADKARFEQMLAKALGK